MEYIKADVKELLTELKPVSKSVVTKLNLQIDNPGGDWLHYEREHVLKNKRTLGALTAKIREIDLPVKFLAKIKGWNNEQANIRKKDLDALVISISKNGFDRTKKPHVAITPRGEVTILEGNHRIMASKILKLKYISLFLFLLSYYVRCCI